MIVKLLNTKYHFLVKYFLSMQKMLGVENILGNLHCVCSLFLMPSKPATLTNYKIWGQTNYKLCNNDMEQLLSINATEHKKSSGCQIRDP